LFNAQRQYLASISPILNCTTTSSLVPALRVGTARTGASQQPSPCNPCMLLL